MVIKDGKVGDFENVTILHISELIIRTKIEFGEGHIAIMNDQEPDVNKTQAESDKLEGIDMLIVGSEKSLRKFAQTILKVADRLKDNPIMLGGTREQPNQKSDS